MRPFSVLWPVFGIDGIVRAAQSTMLASSSSLSMPFSRWFVDSDLDMMTALAPMFVKSN